jgi:hypothetical protein
MIMSKDYKLEIAFIQSTKGEPDGETLISDVSEDPSIHLIKTKVFSKHLTAAVDAITQELCDLGLADIADGNLGGGSSGKK